MDEIIKLVKRQKMWTTSAFDELIMSKAQAAMSDMASVGIPEMSDPLYREAVVTYCVIFQSTLPVGGATVCALL